MIETCDRCGTEVKPLQTYASDLKPGRLIWVELVSTTPLPVALESWTEHRQERCTARRAASVSGAVGETQ